MRTCSIAAGLTLSLASAALCARAASPNTDFGIVDEASYQAFKRALSNSEFVRHAYSHVEKPRVIAAAAGLMIYATRNPLADETQLTDFVTAYDEALQTYFVDSMSAPIDPDLQVGAHFLTAARFSTPIPLGVMPSQVGTDTDVGEDVLELLDVAIPGPLGFEGMKRRMVVFDRARTHTFGESPAWMAILVNGFLGRDLSGAPNQHIAAVLGAYLTGEGLDSAPASGLCVPDQISSLDTGHAKGVVIDGNLAYIADTEAGLAIVDITNPAAPTLVGSVFASGGLAFNVAVSGNFAYLVSSFGGGVDVIDIGNPASPMIVGSTGIGDSYSSVDVQGSLLYVTHDADLLVIDVSTPASPTVIGSITTPGLGFAVAVSGTTAFVADRFSGLQVVDVSNPASPVIVGSAATPGAAIGIAIDGAHAYVASDDGGLAIFDVSNPTTPLLLSVVDTPGNARNVAVVGSRAFVADEGSGLQVIYVGDPSNPVLIGSADTPDIAFGVAVAGGFAYVGDQQSGLQVIELATCLSTPSEIGLAALPPDFATYSNWQQEVATALLEPDPELQKALLSNTQLWGTVLACFDNIALETNLRKNELAAISDANLLNLQQGRINGLNQPFVDLAGMTYLGKIDLIAADRAALAANSFMLLQSPSAGMQSLALSTQRFTGQSIKLNQGFAAAGQSAQILGGFATVLAGALVGKGDPVAIVGGVVDIVSGALGLGDLFGSGPSAEDQIFDQITQMRDQIMDMQIQLNDRFDRVEVQLNAIFTELQSSFDALGMQIGELAFAVDVLESQMLEVLATLERLEDALWGMGTALLESLLQDDANLLLDFRQSENAIDLPYSGAPSFLGGENTFFGHAYDLNDILAGTNAPALTVGNAAAALTGASIGRNVNQLREFPATDLFPTDINGPAPWAQGAGAYVQLAKESPWYFARMTPSSTPNLDLIILRGNNMLQAMSNGRNGPNVFNPLFIGYKNTLTSVTTILNTKIAALSPPLAPWAGTGRNAQPYAQGNAPTFNLIERDPFSGYTAFTIGIASTNNYRIYGPTDLPETAALLYGVDAVVAGAPGGGSFRFDFDEVNGDLKLDLIFRRKLPEVGELRRRLVLRYFLNNPDERVIVHGEDSGQQHDADEVLMRERFALFAYMTNGADTNLLGVTIQVSTGYRFVVQLDQFVVDTLSAAVNTSLANMQDTVWTNAANDGGMDALDANFAGYLALIESFVTFSMPELFEKSAVARAALRGEPADHGMLTDNALAVRVWNNAGVAGGALEDLLRTFVGAGDNGQNIWPSYVTQLNQRVDWLKAEIDASLVGPPGHGYLNWMRAELQHLKDYRLRLAIDDTYLATQGQTLNIAAPQGVIVNDVLQPHRPICVDLATAPSMTSEGGTVMLDFDGSFMYTPPSAEFTGTDTFTYRLASDAVYREKGTPIPQCAPTATVFSDPATVVIRVAPPSFCPGDADGSGFIDFDDITSVIANWGANYGAGTGPGDANNDSVVDFDDITEALANWGATCP